MQLTTPSIADDKTLQEWRETARFWTKHSDTIRTMFAPLTEAPISASEYWELRAETSDTLRAKLAKLSPDRVLRVKQDVLEAAGEFFPNDQMNFPAQMIIVTGKRPA